MYPEIRNKNLVVNLAADGIQKAVIPDTTLAPEIYTALADQYVKTYLEGTSVGRILFNICYKRAITDSNVFDSVLYNVLSMRTKVVPLSEAFLPLQPAQICSTITVK